ncbi:hypothetical protein [Pseudoxanthomonas sp.]|uniref:hypothetical protein n=1 Tax=Pseudoxanthomonas sp. TaxID=1871049 RepID=UPI00261DE07A|nr:hypothetical protein [Pseudoxanthomonas sp.]WDS37827.1 MAG: hypothetical protein O8I58_08155 [Pseudoxanthomonas sp.]
MVEDIYNIYLFFDPKGRCARAGYAVHAHTGSDEEGLQRLTKMVKADLQRATKLNLRTSFSIHEYNTRCRLGTATMLYDEVLQHAGAGLSPLMVVTPVLNGKTHFNHTSQHGDFDVSEASEAAGEHGKMVDWLVKYTSDRGIDLSQLIHDDYFAAIKLTFQAQQYVSSMKLLLSCIDSIAYIEFGDERGAPTFVRWLHAYADLDPLGITAEELWELRNGLLHMTNISSSAVKQSRVRRISFRIGNSQAALPDTGSAYYFDFRGLINVFAQAQAKWLQTYSASPDKFNKFVERYDETVSDGRLAYHSISS